MANLWIKCLVERQNDSMAGFIVLDDGRAYAASNWAFRATVESITQVLAGTPQGSELSVWLRSDANVQYLHSLDLRELTAKNRELFINAAVDAFSIQRARGPVGWEEPEFWDGWIARFGEFLQMIECVKRSEPPADFNPHMKGLIPPTGLQAGPGW